MNHIFTGYTVAYRISGFSCEQTAPWERTLENPTSLSIMILDDDSFEMSVVWTLVDDCGLRMPYHVNLKVEVGATRHVLCKLESNGIANGVVQTSKNSHGFTSLQFQICPRRNARMPPVVSDVVVAAAVEDCSGYFSANVEFVHVCSWSASLFHFDTMSTSKRPDFVLDTVFQNPPLPLPTPPPQHPTLLLPTPEAQPPPSTARKPIPIPMKPTSPALSTTASNKPEVAETETQKPTSPETTPPGNQNPVETDKEPKRKNPPESSAQRSLFTGNQGINPTEATKKTKHEDNTKPDP
ncbi:hypothetical protein Tco_0622429 [Tanacetum coccineum]